jgi:HEPN domain-containing protein
MPDSIIPAEWFAQGDQDVQAAEILLAQNGPLAIAAFHLQQAIEKYLKGFLLSTAWPLRRIHDLEILLQQAIAQDADFAPFLAACQRITEYYIEARYPIGVTTPFQRVALQADLDTTRDLIALIRRKVRP